MQLKERLRLGARSVVAAILVIAVCSTGARADEGSGTWTGGVGLWGNYYWETSTRVVAPEVTLRLTTPDGIDMRADYLVDAITSASVAAGVIEDIRFTEVRNQGTIGFGREFDLGGAALRLDLNGRISHEPDYLATGISLSGSLSLAERCSVIGFSLGYIHDDVGAVVRGGAPRTDDTGRDLSNRGRLGELEGIMAGISFSQILSPIATASIGYDLVHNWGFLQNPYRQVMVEGALMPEAHPEARTRHSFYGRLALFVPPTRTAFHVFYRVYLDDWELGALTPEARIYQEVGDDVTLRFRYRYYNQLRSFFYRTPDQYMMAMDGTRGLFTADPKMSEFESHLLGVEARIQLAFLHDSPLSFLEDGAAILSFDYLWQGSRFGNGIIGQVGVDVPF